MSADYDHYIEAVLRCRIQLAALDRHIHGRPRWFNVFVGPLPVPRVRDPNPRWWHIAARAIVRWL
jgi:hypothetical protein